MNSAEYLAWLTNQAQSENDVFKQELADLYVALAEIYAREAATKGYGATLVYTPGRCASLVKDRLAENGFRITDAHGNYIRIAWKE